MLIKFSKNKNKSRHHNNSLNSKKCANNDATHGKYAAGSVIGAAEKQDLFIKNHSY